MFELAASALVVRVGSEAGLRLLLLKRCSMKDKIVIVTGASGGLETHVTQAFLDAGATVVGISRNIRQSDFSNPAFAAHPADLSAAEAAREVADFTVARFGRLDVLAHLMGGFSGGKPVAETDDATFQSMFDVNVNTSVHIVRATLPHLRRAGHGRIIAIGSRLDRTRSDRSA